MLQSDKKKAFTLIELLVVISIIALLISILMPSLSRAREQAKSTHCLAKLKDFANGLAAYENIYQDHLPPAEWYPDEDNFENLRYGWAELLFDYIYKEDTFTKGNYEPQDCPPNFPAMRNMKPSQFDNYFTCKSANERGPNSGQYRVYLPSWSGTRASLDEEGRFDLDLYEPRPTTAASRTSMSPKMPLIMDANEYSYRGDGDPQDGPESCGLGDDCSYIDAAEANASGTTGENGNRISDRHSGGANYLFQDFHAEWRRNFHHKLGLDWDLNGTNDIEVE